MCHYEAGQLLQTGRPCSLAQSQAWTWGAMVEEHHFIPCFTRNQARRRKQMHPTSSNHMQPSRQNDATLGGTKGTIRCPEKRHAGSITGLHASRSYPKAATKSGHASYPDLAVAGRGEGMVWYLEDFKKDACNYVHANSIRTSLLQRQLWRKGAKISSIKTLCPMTLTTCRSPFFQIPSKLIHCHLLTWKTTSSFTVILSSAIDHII